VQLGADLALMQAEPALHALAEAEMGEIDQPERGLESAPGWTVEIAEQLLQQIEEQLRRAVAVGLGERRSRGRLDAEQTKRAAVGSQRGSGGAQALLAAEDVMREYEHKVCRTAVGLTRP
jgi:hypothetical protein